MMNNLGIAYEKVGRGADAYAAYLRALDTLRASEMLVERAA